MNWVAVARQHRAMGVLVIVDECELHLPAWGMTSTPGLVDELVLQDADGGAHLAVGPVLGPSDPSTPQNAPSVAPFW